MIITAVQKGRWVVAYGPGNSIVVTKEGTLVGFTPTTISVKVGRTIRTYGEKGQTISVVEAK